MKKICMVVFLLASLCICSLAMARDVDGVDVFAGNSLSMIASVDVSSLVNNKMVYENLDEGKWDSILVMLWIVFAAYYGEDTLELLGELDVDYRKDIKSIVFAGDMDGHACFLFDSTKSANDVWGKIMVSSSSRERSWTATAPVCTTEACAKARKHGKYDVVTFKKPYKKAVTGVLLSDERILFCDKGFDTNTVLDNVANPKTLKAADGVLYTAYSQTSAKADVRVAAKMTDVWRKDAAMLKLSDSISAADAEAFSLSADLKKGSVLDARVLAKSDKIASDAAAILQKEVASRISDPSLSSAIKVAASKKYLTLRMNLDDDQVVKVATWADKATDDFIEKSVKPLEGFAEAILIGVAILSIFSGNRGGWQ